LFWDKLETQGKGPKKDVLKKIQANLTLKKTGDLI